MFCNVNFSTGIFIQSRLLCKRIGCGGGGGGYQIRNPEIHVSAHDKKK